MSAAAVVTVDGAVRRRRLDRYLADVGAWGSRARVQRLIAAGRVLVDGAVAAADTIVRPGQEIRVADDSAPMPVSAVEPEAIPLVILHEDERILVVNKPAGLVVHPASGHWRGTLVAALLHHWRGPRPGLDPERLGLVHRLDKDTSGVLVVAKDADALEQLGAQFRARTVEKEYVAFVFGRPAATAGVIDAPIGRHPVHRKQMAVRAGGRPAVTRYEVVAADAEIAMVRLWPRTGRTHQIRVHLRALGHPIVGDAVYGKDPAGATARVGRQALHAARLTFCHPESGERVSFVADLPADLAVLVGRFVAAEVS